MMCIAAAAILFASCTQIAGSHAGNSDSTAVNTDSSHMAIIRDESISEANAYSDIFLDSASIENFIRTEKLNDTTARGLRNFYLVRNNQFAWFNTTGLTEPARGLWSLYTTEKESAAAEPGKKLKAKMDSLLQQDTVMVDRSDSSIIRTELNLTTQLLQYAAENRTGLINPNTVYYLVPAKKMDALTLADSMLHKQRDSAQYAGNRPYGLLKQQLSMYYDVARQGGWDSLSVTAKLRKGMTSPAVITLKKRLALTHDYSADTSNVFTDSLEAAVKDVQQRNGLLATGMVSDSLIRQLNVPVEQRIQQLIVNMNRLVWTQQPSDSNRLQVNIPSFMLYAFEGSNRVFEMPVITGKEGTSTVMFTGNINEIVFNPAWNIPESIVRNEIMPAMKTDKNYLSKHHMEIVKQNDSLPQIRQMPGKENALGQIKFLFPNSYDIYLHDTPDKTLFARNNRALSHGCIRVADAPKLAQYLLRDQSDWTVQKINTVTADGKEQHVSVKTPEAVSITYYTAWVDEKGKLNFRPDVYGHDQRAADKMFVAKP